MANVVGAPSSATRNNDYSHIYGSPKSATPTPSKINFLSKLQFKLGGIYEYLGRDKIYNEKIWNNT